MIYSFKGFTPVIDPTSFVHPLAAVTGHVVIGANVYIGPGAAIRGDWGKIIIEDGCNVQENCTIHMFPGTTVHLMKNTHVGHGAIIHGATVQPDCLIGMNSVIMDHVMIGKESIIGALTFITEGAKLAPRSLAVGNPFRIIKEVSDDMLAWKIKGTLLYQSLPADMYAHWHESNPLTEIPEDQPPQEKLYERWKEYDESG